METATAPPTFYKANRTNVAGEIGSLQRQGDGPPRYQLKDGKNKVRILPAYNASGDWYELYGMHFKMPVNHTRTSWPCARFNSEDCLFCDSAHDLRNTDAWKVFKASQRVVYNVTDPDDPNSGVLILEVGLQIHKQVLAFMEQVDITDPTAGYSFTIDRQKTGPAVMNVEYTVIPDLAPSALADWSILDDLVDLSTVAIAPDMATQIEVMSAPEATSTSALPATLPAAVVTTSAPAAAPALAAPAVAAAAPVAAPPPPPVDMEDLRRQARERVQNQMKGGA